MLSLAGPIDRLTGCLSPIFDVEALDATEFPSVVGHQNESQATGMRCDKQIVCADHGSEQLEIGANLSVV